MTARLLLSAMTLAIAATASMAPVAQAANADNPYGNVDKRNDKGNDTGDSQVDKLNSGQLNQNYTGPTTDRNAGQGAPTPAVSPAPASGQPAPAR